MCVRASCVALRLQQTWVKIEHNGAMLTQQIVMIDANGGERRVTCAYEIGAESVNEIGGAKTRSTARWADGELVLETWLQAPSGEVYFQDHWSLSNDGQVLTMEHRDDALAGQISRLQRSAEPQPQLFQPLSDEN